MTTSTPWGQSQQSDHITRGIVNYQTASHGGLHVSPGMLKTFPEPFRSAPTWAGPGWYEEDCDWCIPVCARPDLPWPARWHLHAKPTLQRYHPHIFDAAYPNWEGYP